MALLARRAWGEWLNQFLWHHFATLTFRTPTSGDAALRDFAAFRRRLEQRAQAKVSWFRVLERGAGGLLHLHALLAGTQMLPTTAVTAAWHRGRSEVSVYDPGRGASYYVSKTITLTEAEYDLVLPAPALATANERSGPALNAPQRTPSAPEPSGEQGNHLPSSSDSWRPTP